MAFDTDAALAKAEQAGLKLAIKGRLGAAMPFLIFYAVIGHYPAILVGLGVDELSVSLPAIPAIKAQIRGLRMDACRELAEKALAAESAEQVRALVPDLSETAT